jgi:hypothetical protein
MLLFENLGWGMKPKKPSKILLNWLLESEINENNQILSIHKIFHELYCFTFNLFDEEWTITNATIMQFPLIIQNTQKKLDILLNNYSNIYQVIQKNQEYHNQYFLYIF